MLLCLNQKQTTLLLFCLNQKQNRLCFTSKLQKTSSSIDFIKKALHHNVTPTFAQVRGQFVNNKDQLDAERKLMISYLIQYDLKLKEITNKHRTLGQELVKNVGSICYKILLKHMSSS